MKRAINYIIGILLLLSLICNGLLFYLHKQQIPPEVIQVTDTITIYKDSIIEKIKFKTKFDTIINIEYVDTLRHDTIRIHDTIEIPIEHKVDSFTIRNDSLMITEQIHYSGFHSQIDSVLMQYEWQYTMPKQEKKIGIVWSLCFYAGYGMNFNNGLYYFSPEVGIGASIGIGGKIK